ncbi:MAG: hypothetical protein NTW52_04780 [Planctomycetota bacterium]|nr:hypothetical protein [Planctomycetota bacterium]
MKTDQILITHAMATFVMVGVIWLVQLVHYPLMSFVDESRFSDFEQMHRAKIFWIVAPAMLVEGITGLWLAMSLPRNGRRVWIRFGLFLLAVIWLSTAFIQIPLHEALQTKFLQSDLDRLVATNWLRTIAWSIRGAVCFFLLTTIDDHVGLWELKRNANKS